MFLKKDKKELKNTKRGFIPFEVRRPGRLPVRQRIGLQTGFTLIEILVVIGIIALLATIVIIAINPARQFAQARDTQRTANLNTILNGIGQRIADNRGTFTVATGCAVLNTGVAYTIAVGPSAVGVTNPLDMSCLVPTYIPSQLPVDPVGGVWINGTDYNTQYGVTVDSFGRYTVIASSTEPALNRTTAISVVR